MPLSSPKSRSEMFVLALTAFLVCAVIMLRPVIPARARATNPKPDVVTTVASFAVTQVSASNAVSAVTSATSAQNMDQLQSFFSWFACFFFKYGCKWMTTTTSSTPTTIPSTTIPSTTSSTSTSSPSSSSTSTVSRAPVNCGTLFYATGWPTTPAPSPMPGRCLLGHFNAGTSATLITRAQTDGLGGHIVITTYEVVGVQVVNVTTDAINAVDRPPVITREQCTEFDPGFGFVTASNCVPL